MLIDLINGQNADLPVPIDSSSLYFGTPSTNEQGITVVPTVAVLDSVYTGYAKFNYTRINLSTLFDSRPVISAALPPSLYRLLPDLNRLLGIVLTEQDVIDTNIQSIDVGEQVNINVKALPASLGFVGSFIVTFKRVRVMLELVIVSADLNILKHFDEPSGDGKYAISMAMYDIDFSANQSALRLYGNRWYNEAALKAMMLEQGFEDWPSAIVNGVAQYRTSAYPGANTKFTYVVVQRQVNAPLYAGTGLFHYNPL